MRCARKNTTRPLTVWVVGADEIFRLRGTKVIEIFTQAQPSDAFAAYIDSMKVIPFGYMGMEIVDTIVAKGAAGKGDGLEEAIAQIEKIGDKL